MLKEVLQQSDRVVYFVAKCQAVLHPKPRHSTSSQVDHDTIATCKTLAREGDWKYYSDGTCIDLCRERTKRIGRS